MTAQEELENRLKQLEAECARLREENTQLRERLSLPSDVAAQFAPADSTAFLDQASPASKKIELFQQLFRGREDVYPLRWENRRRITGEIDVAVIQSLNRKIGDYGQRLPFDYSGDMELSKPVHPTTGEGV